MPRGPMDLEGVLPLVWAVGDVEDRHARLVGAFNKANATKEKGGDEHAAALERWRAEGESSL